MDKVYMVYKNGQHPVVIDAFSTREAAEGYIKNITTPEDLVSSHPYYVLEFDVDFHLNTKPLMEKKYVTVLTAYRIDGIIRLQFVNETNNVNVELTNVPDNYGHIKFKGTLEKGLTIFFIDKKPRDKKEIINAVSEKLKEYAINQIKIETY